jgi:hypothetical protein
VTPEQREAATDYIANGATLREAGSLCGVPWADFARCYAGGRMDFASGIESEDAAWYVVTDAASASFDAALRSRVADSAGTRESSDLLALLRHRESQEEPVAQSETSVRDTDPLLVLRDEIDDPTTPAEERERLQGILRDLSMAMNAAFVEITRPERRRVGV